MPPSRLLLILLTAAILPALPARAQSRAEKGSLSFQFENDLFFNQDHDYTNGVQLAYTTAPDDTPDWAVDLARMVPLFHAEGVVRTRYALGQTIYTPENTTLANPLPGDRPYAGFLYASMGLVTDSGTDLDQFQVTLGVIGPASLASDSQKWIHTIIDEEKPAGWSTQLRDEPGLLITYQRTMKIIPPQSALGGVFDIAPHWGAAIGNVYDYANAGAMARLGFNLPQDYGPIRIQPSLPGSGYFEPTAGFGAYLFAGVEGRAVARNLFLDGNSFEPSRSVSKFNLVGDALFGLALTFESFRIAFTHVIRTREYKGQQNQNAFGAVDLTIRF